MKINSSLTPLAVSATAPVTEVIRDGENGLLVDFFDTRGIAERVDVVLGEPQQYDALRKRARGSIAERFDLHGVCLPRQLEIIGSAMRRGECTIPGSCCTNVEGDASPMSVPEVQEQADT